MNDVPRSEPLLFAPLELRSVTLPNRVVIPPMCVYAAKDGMPNDWHLVHYGKFATGGVGLIIGEATAVEERGRITPGDIGLWRDDQVAAHRRLTDFLKGEGCVPGVQLAHAGRRASSQPPFHGGRSLTAEDERRLGYVAWQAVAPSPVPEHNDSPIPAELDSADIKAIVDAFAAGARRALEAGYEVAEIHGAHGYLLHEFLSPAVNRRDDAYGGDREGRMRLPLEVTEAVRREWPADKPLIFRVSAVDGEGEGAWLLDDTLVLCRELGERGVDVIDCSSGGIRGPATAAVVPRGPGYQVPFAETIKRQTGLTTMAVGLITKARQAEAILVAGQADLIAVGREMLDDPNWTLRAANELGYGGAPYAAWPPNYGWWLERRARTVAMFKDAG
ncbi:MAG: NADH:flavin oxidoreductase/NADH oxidase [Alphaproteobacteria bacterium]|nr:NADH:flavin oxidoreductase/NADH oxidase [Alphaproteobacteria bacterium]MDP6620806.1 NADH:flavin oxidoreductase/NADH oxidase [Alphaproteobacteria bacterium]